MTNRIRNWVAIGFLILIVNAGYLAAFASATVFYMGNVLFHVALGIAITGALFYLLRKSPDMAQGAPTALGFFLVSFAAGAFLTWKGSLIEFRWVLLAHVVTGVLCVAALIPWVWKKDAENGGALAAVPQRLSVRRHLSDRFARWLTHRLPQGLPESERSHCEPARRSHRDV